MATVRIPPTDGASHEGGMHWPADDILKEKAAGKGKLRFRDIPKYALAFVDEAIILLIFGYLAYKMLY